jgi:hypothetical protein
MARFYGFVGFIRTDELDPVNHPGIYSEIIDERPYYGDVFQNSRRWEQGEINETLVVNNRVSIVADDYLNNNIGAMRYVKMNGERWKITNVEIQRPRLILTIGGIYNGPED